MVEWPFKLIEYYLRWDSVLFILCPAFSFFQELGLEDGGLRPVVNISLLMAPSFLSFPI